MSHSNNDPPPSATRRKRLLALRISVSAPFVGMGFVCGCGILMDNRQPPPVKQALQVADMSCSVVTAAVWSPVWVPKMLHPVDPKREEADSYEMIFFGGPIATKLYEAKLKVAKRKQAAAQKSQEQGAPLPLKNDPPKNPLAKDFDEHRK